jgi:hypothetical protein
VATDRRQSRRRKRISSAAFLMQNGCVPGYTIHPGNEHDSRTFPAICERLKKYDPALMVLDAGYKTPAIAKTLPDDGIKPVYPYRRPMTKKEFFKKHEYVYDEYFDCYLCPNNQVLCYATTNREGYREYKSDPSFCVNCPYLSQCTESKSHQKTVTRHIWEPYLEICEEIRHTVGMKEWYEKRKESIERIFGTAKEFHGMRYTRYNGKALMEMKVGLTFACMNLKKLAKMKKRKGLLDPVDTSFLLNSFRNLIRSLKKKSVSEVLVF